MELGTFGAVLKYAIEIEDCAASFYEKLAETAPEGMKSGLSGFAAASRKNRQTIERTRRMEMQEMILEAITGLDTKNYEGKYGGEGDIGVALRKALEMEANAARFYSDSSKKLSFLGNVSKTLEKLGKDREERAKRVQALL